MAKVKAARGNAKTTAKTAAKKTKGPAKTATPVKASPRPARGKANSQRRKLIEPEVELPEPDDSVALAAEPTEEPVEVPEPDAPKPARGKKAKPTKRAKASAPAEDEVELPEPDAVAVAAEPASDEDELELPEPDPAAADGEGTIDPDLAAAPAGVAVEDEIDVEPEHFSGDTGDDEPEADLDDLGELESLDGDPAHARTIHEYEAAAAALEEAAVASGADRPRAFPRDVEVELPEPDLAPIQDAPSALARRTGFRERARGLLGLAGQIASQAFSSDTLGQVAGAAQGLWGALRTGLGVARSTEVDAYGRDPQLETQLSGVADFLYDRYWRVAVEGAALVPDGPCILVANHSGAVPFDGPVIRQALGRERPDLPDARWLIEDQVFYAPFLGTIFNRLGAIRACPENALALLKEGRPVIVFPEGIQGLSKPFAQRYQLKRLGRGGFAKLAVRTGAPIIPVAVVGGEEAVPLLAKLPGKFLGLPYLPLTTAPLPTKWSLRFGEPIFPEEGTRDGDAGAEVQRIVDATRSSIEGMLHALLADRRSVFGG